MQKRHQIYQVSKLITRIFKKRNETTVEIQFKEQYQTRQTFKNTHVNKCTKLFSFDISSMYINIPINENNTYEMVSPYIKNYFKSKLFSK